MFGMLKDKDGTRSLGRHLTVLGAMALTFGFYREALTNGLIWQDYIGYAIAMTVMYAPTKAVDLIKAIRGNPTVDTSASEETKTTAPAPAQAELPEAPTTPSKE